MSNHHSHKKWYAGFRCWGNPENIQNTIAQKVKNLGLNTVITDISYLEKQHKNNGKQEFYLFAEIDNFIKGDLPREFKEGYLKPLLLNNLVGSFTYAEIQAMISPGHEYTIPFQESTKHSNYLESFEILDHDFPSNPNLIQLLDWLSAKAYGSWRIFQDTCQILKIEKPSRIVRNLKLLGYLETSTNGKKWSIAPTALVPLNHDSENLEFYLCGQQNDYLRQQLAKLADIKEEGQPTVFGLPRRKVIFSDRSVYDHLKKLGEIPIHKPGNIAQRLADCLPTLQEWQATLPAVGGVVPSQRYWQQYQPETNNFQECGLPEKTGLYEMRREANQNYPDRTFFYEANTKVWREADWYGLRFLTLYHSEFLQECHYYPDRKQLVILSDQRWPQLYERSLVLASGYLPQVSSDRLFYHNITPELAKTLTQKLSIHCQGL